MAGALFVYEGAVARRCRRRTRPCVFVCCVFVCCCCCLLLLLLLLLLLFVHAGVGCVASMDV